MKLIFICGSLEPSCDGVGDYTRRMAGELIRLGHETYILALKDYYVSNVYEGIQKAQETLIPVKRLPFYWPERKRYAVVDSYIKYIKPSWISFQFVPFSFHKKGLPLGLGNHLKPLIGRINIHIMFHELWMGMEENTSWKQWIIGIGQKFLIHSLLEKIRPNLIHTQSSFYQIQLKKLGFSAQLLPLFGNVPRKAQREKLLNIENNQPKKKFKGVIFGSIRKNSPIEHLAEEASSISKKEGIHLELIIIGRSGAEEENWVRTWKKAGLGVQVLGEQPPEVISEVFENSSFGISTTPLPLIEKSGAVAAMREHDLPILCVSKPWNHLKSLETQPPLDITLYQKGILKLFLDENLNYSIKKSFCDIPLQFINSLTF